MRIGGLIGIQTLTKMAIPARLAHPAISGESVPAVVLETKPDRAGEVGLLMPAKVVEGGEDFDWAKFRVMQKSDSVPGEKMRGDAATVRFSRTGI